MAKKKEDTVEPLYNYAVAIPVHSEYKRKQVYKALRGFCSCEISSPDSNTIKIQFFGETDSKCELDLALLKHKIKGTKAAKEQWVISKEPIQFRVGDLKFHAVSRNCVLSVEAF